MRSAHEGLTQISTSVLLAKSRCHILPKNVQYAKIFNILYPPENSLDPEQMASQVKKKYKGNQHYGKCSENFDTMCLRKKA